MTDNSLRVIEVDTNDILPNRFQPRIQFDEDEILELSDSIKEHGVIHPLLVRPIGDKYEIIAGERRYKACVLAGKETVPVVIRDLDDKECAEIALIENVQRKSLSPIEEALSIKKRLDMGNITQGELAEKIGKSQSAVANKLRLLNLSDDVQNALLENKISERHARSLLKLSTEKLQNNMLEKIINERLTVRQTDEEINKVIKGDNNMNNVNNILNSSGTENTSVEIPAMNSFNSTTVEVPTFNATPPVSTSQTEMPSMSSIDSGMFNLNTPPVSVPQTEIPSMSSIDSGMFNLNTPPVSTPQTEIPSMSSIDSGMFNLNTPPVSTPQTEMPSMSSIDSGMFNLNTPPVSTPQTEMPSMSSMDNGIFNLNTSPVSTPQTEIPSMSSIDNETPNIGSMSTLESQQIQNSNSQVEAPSFSFDNLYNEPKDILNNQNTMNTQDQKSMFEIPKTNPIIDNTESLDTSSKPKEEDTALPPTYIENDNIQSTSNQGPIIVTDYTKQYDPVMPFNEEPVINKVDFKEIINILRNCSAEIEKSGYKLDLEEYDLENIYQVVFKIEK